MKLKCYYAHSMMSYGSTIEQMDIKLLEKLGFEVENPNQPKYQKGCKDYVNVHGFSKTMDYFGDIILECDILAFRSLPDGTIPSGISYEINKAKEYNIPVIEIPCSLSKRMMDYAQTKEYFTEIGHYKVNKK